jgi:hypothetical protein
MRLNVFARESRRWAPCFAAIVLLMPMAIGTPFGAAPADEVKQRLLGEWTLVKYEVFGENGETRPGNYDVARIAYGEREMSAHLMRSGAAKQAPTTDASRAEAYQRYLGYFGPYTIDTDKRTVTHHVAGSSFPHWIGSEQVRHYAFMPNGQLTLSLKAGERITQTLTWARTR